VWARYLHCGGVKKVPKSMGGLCEEGFLPSNWGDKWALGGDPRWVPPVVYSGGVLRGADILSGSWGPKEGL